MEKIFKYAMMAAMTAMIQLSFTACSDSESDDSNGTGSSSAKETALKTVNAQFVNSTVIPIYNGLTDACLELQNTIEEIDAKKTDTSVAAACEKWKTARQYWEWSEAFLFGAAANYGIDPHIDTWPLDEASLTNLLISLPEDVQSYVANLNNGLVGFHGLEYIIFRNGESRTYSDIMNENGGKELEYAKAVAYDLVLSACRLEAAWAGIDNIDSWKAEILEDEEMEPTDNFGEEMELCGQAGSRWKTVTLGTRQIIAGCKEIIGEVRDSKIGSPHTGEDVTYIESPHAYNSIQDFYDNIMSCQYVLYGGYGATSARTGSLIAYAQNNHSAIAASVKTALENALSAVAAMKAPFVLYYSDASAGDAMDALDGLDDALSELDDAIAED